MPLALLEYRLVRDMTEHLHEKISALSSEPGVYLMKDDAGVVIYVGKAQNLKKRIASYFKASGQLDMKTGVLVKKIAAFDTIITSSEKEALILESNLIKRHRPRYNVILKDDKRYPSLRLDISDPYPSLEIVRKTRKDGALYFGPFASAYAVRQTLKFINKTFKLRKCRAREFKHRTRPCLHCQMEGCLAPCCLDVDKRSYDEIVKDVILLLRGRTPELIRKIKMEMLAAAQSQDYEKAAALRDKMLALEKTVEKQVAVTIDFMDRDVIALAGTCEFSCVTLLNVRGGYVMGTRNFSFPETLSSDSEMIGTFIRQYYENSHFAPKEILVSVQPEDASVLAEWLRNIRGAKVAIMMPQRGEKRRLVEMALQNAANGLKDLLAENRSHLNILSRLQARLNLTRLPTRIECFDNSNISGAAAVASMVVFENAKPQKSAYRKYKVRSVFQPDDYAYMAEVLRRRFDAGVEAFPYPDLLMVDGGKGQLNIAVSIVRELGIESSFDIIGIAKKDTKKGEIEDKIFKPGRANPVSFGKAADLLFLLQRIRDEAHRFAITFHRRRRTKTAMQSVLDSVPGIGKKRKTVLLKHFGSVKKMQAASLDELSQMPGMNRKAAEALKSALSR